MSETTTVSELAADILATKARIAIEMRDGGDQEPCPHCGVKRVRRSDYIRCMRCGLNWLDGQDLSRDPRTRERAMGR